MTTYACIESSMIHGELIMPAILEKPIKRCPIKQLAPDKKRYIRRELTDIIREYGPQEDILQPCVAIVDILADIIEKQQHSPVQAALVRGEIAKEKYKQYSPYLSTEEYAKSIGISRQAVLKRLHSGSLLSWQEHKQKAFQIPLWQFSNSGAPLPGLDSIMKILNIPGLDGWGKILFFLQRRESLNGKTPLDLLKAGNLQHVIELAENYVS